MFHAKSGFLAVVLLTAAVCLSPLAGHATENLDPAFGVQGIVITDFGVADDEASALAVQPDGKILLAGFSSNSAVKDIAVVRYLDDGMLDTSFHTTGYVTFNVGDGNAVARALAVQEDGKIIIAGNLDNGANEASSEIFLTRLTAEGYPDIAFGTEGMVVLPLEGKTGSAYDLQITPEGDILVAGTAGDTNGLRAMVARIDVHGVLDSGFGENGIVIVPRDYETAAHSLVLQADNSILMAGYGRPEEEAGINLVRLRADGALDQSFGNGGEVQIPVQDGEAIVYDMIAQADGRLLVVGSFANGRYREVLLGRFLANGTADTSFGSGGLIRNDLGYDSVGYGVALQTDGSILATGFSETDKGKDVILLRYGTQGAEVKAAKPAGTTQTTSAGLSPTALANSQSLTTRESDPSPIESEPAAGSTGDSRATATYISESVSIYDDESRALAVLADGRVLTAGYAGNGDDTDFALLRFSTAAVDTLADPVTGAGGIASGNFSITTTSITNISRNSAMSGGSISERVTTNTKDCEAYCETQCDTGDSSCYDTCYDGCYSAPTVKARGVCYGTARHPVYRTTVEETDTTTTTTSDTTDTTTSILPAASKETSFNYETVLFGQTSDGSGIGAFGSNIVDITPNTVYYVRAYAVLADDTVIYGNELSFETSDACFIATAAYGSLLDTHVVLLRKFRDAYLKGNGPGRIFIAFYYRFSPMIAEIIGNHESLKQVVRVCLWPWVAFSYIMLHVAMAAKVMLLLLGVITGGLVVHSLRTNKRLKKLS